MRTLPPVRRATSAAKRSLSGSPASGTCIVSVTCRLIGAPALSAAVLLHPATSSATMDMWKIFMARPSPARLAASSGHALESGPALSADPDLLARPCQLGDDRPAMRRLAIVLSAALVTALAVAAAVEAHR